MDPVPEYWRYFQMNNILYENNTLSFAARYMLLIIAASYGVPTVKLFYGQNWILHVRCRYLFMLHPKMFALCPIPSAIWAISYVICLLSLMLCANWCVTCGICYDVCSGRGRYRELEPKITIRICENQLHECLIHRVLYESWIPG